MGVFVDQMKTFPTSMIKPAARANGPRWCHLSADTEEELHAFAARLGLKREWVQRDRNPALIHYDLVPSKRALAVRLGATELDDAAFGAYLLGKARLVREGLHAGDTPSS